MRTSRFLLPQLKRPSDARSARTIGGLARTGDEGFSVVEVIVAMAVFAVVAMMLSGLLASGLKGVLLGKRREVGTQEAQKALEIARSLSYQAVGLTQTDPTIATDSAIQTQGGVKKYGPGSGLEPIVWAASGAGHPFNPHTLDITRGSTKLTRYVYVTGVDSNNDGAIDLKRVSVRVTWNDAGAAGPANEVRAQTLINQSGGVFNDTLTPLSGQTNVEAGSASVKLGLGNLGSLINAVLPTDPVTVKLPTSTGKSDFRAVSSVNCTARSTSLQGANNTYGGHPVSVTADDDSQTDTPSNPPAQSWSASDGITGTDDVANLVVETAFTSPVSCGATAEDRDLAPPTDDGLAYEKGTGSGPGSLNLIGDLTGAGLPSNVLTALSLAPQPVSQEIDHTTVGGQREVVSTATSGQGAVHVLKIPSVFSEGLVRIDAVSYGASVHGPEGTPTTAPSVTAPNPLALRVYDPNNALTTCSSRSGGYCVVNINPLAEGFTGVNIQQTGTLLQNLGLTKLTYSVDVNALPPSKDPLDGVVGPTGERRWSAEYTPLTVSARLTVEVTVDVLLNIKVVLLDSKVDLDLGKVSATACAGVTCPE
jgi:prepilin-type N-terminal cleavage/methylation domain-containing protein